MRHYFGLNGWPTSSVLGGRAPADEAEQAVLIDTLQDWKTEKYKDIIGGGGSVGARRGGGGSGGWGRGALGQAAVLGRRAPGVQCACLLSTRSVCPAARAGETGPGPCLRSPARRAAPCLAHSPPALLVCLPHPAGSGKVAARPGVVRLMDEARAAGVPVAVCSAATKSAVEFVLSNLLGADRFTGLDLFMAGDDVKQKKPDPTIYKVRARVGGRVGYPQLVARLPKSTPAHLPVPIRRNLQCCLCSGIAPLPCAACLVCRRQQPLPA